VKRRAPTHTLSAARDASTPLRRRASPRGGWYHPPLACRDSDRASRPVVGASARPRACVSQCGECLCCRRKQQIPAGLTAGARVASAPDHHAALNSLTVEWGVAVAGYARQRRCDVWHLEFRIHCCLSEDPVRQQHRRATTMRDPSDSLDRQAGVLGIF